MAHSTTQEQLKEINQEDLSLIVKEKLRDLVGSLDYNRAQADHWNIAGYPSKVREYLDETDRVINALRRTINGMR